MCVRRNVFGTKGGGDCYSLVTRADGTFVGRAGYSNGPRAKPEETITFYAVGPGSTNPIVGTGQASPASPPAIIVPTSVGLLAGYVLTLPASSPGPPVVWAPAPGWIDPSYRGLVPGYVGPYQINVQLPAELAQARPQPGSGVCTLVTRIAIGGGLFGPGDGVSFVDVYVQP